MKKDALKILDFLHLMEKLKKIRRHSWLSDGRHESVAEHTWRVSLMLMLTEPYLGLDFDSNKTLRMIIIHDIIETIAGDIPAFDSFDKEVKKKKIADEMNAMRQIKEMLNNPTGEEIYSLWHEFEAKESTEAKVANALDKLEAQIQHNEADLETWLPIEKDMLFMLDKHVDFNNFLSIFKDIIVEEGKTKLEM